MYNSLMSNKPLFKLRGVAKPRKSSIRKPSYTVGGKRLSPKQLLILTYLTSFIFVGIIVGTIGVIITFAIFSRELPNPNTLLERSTELSTKIYDRNGDPLYEVYGDKNRQLITIDKVSPNVVHATLATEDAEFYIHNGFSLRGMLRAVKNMIMGESVQSGSTITQQVVKNALLSQEQTLTRKIKELILSLQLENRYSKEEILQMYLNETPYGGQNYGIVTAARSFFNKEPTELTLAESAYLAGVPQRPSYYSYWVNPEAGIERKNYVLYLMRNYGWIEGDGKRHYISEEEYQQARDEEMDFQSAPVSFKAPHFVFFVRQFLADKFGEEAVESGGLHVTTTLDLKLQEKAQEIVYDEITKNQVSLNMYNGALVAMESKTGQILAMVGSKGYFLESEPDGCISGITGEDSCLFEPNLNVTISRRQPGSSIKPITYANMLMQGYTAAYPFLDVPTVFLADSQYDKPYTPENYDGQFRGPMSLRKSLGNSLNIPAVKALQIGGIDSMIDLAEKMGITTLKERERYGLALTLGGGETRLLEMTGAYATFANKGMYHEPSSVLEVKDSTGKVLYKWRDNGGTNAVSEGVAFLISDILSDDGARSEAFGFGSLLHIPNYTVAAKTGTTDDKRDNYAMGYTPEVTVGVWVGNNNNEEMNPYVASGISGATPIWSRFMKTYLEGKENVKFEVPKNVKKVEVDELTGMLPFEGFSSRSEWFIEGTEPTAKSLWYERIEVCEDDGKIANDSCKESGDTDVKTFVRITAEIAEWQDDVDRWVYEHYKGDDKYFPPLTKSHLEYDDDGNVTNEDDIFVDIVGLKDGDRVSKDFRLQVEVSAGNDIDKIKIYDNGKHVADDSSYPYGYNFSFEDSGEHSFEVRAVDEEGNEGKTKIKLQVGY
jgi:membrane peptidoglycan carboxypeptidase